MSSNQRDAKSAIDPARPPWAFALFTLTAAFVAAMAAGVSVALQFEVWVMFAGFIAWYSRPGSPGDGIASLICLWLGILLSVAAHLATGALMLALGLVVALSIVVFCVATLVVGLRATPVLGNLLAWFLGLVTHSAAKIELSHESLLHLFVASGIGGIAGWLSQALTRRWSAH